MNYKTERPSFALARSIPMLSISWTALCPIKLIYKPIFDKRDPRRRGERKKPVSNRISWTISRANGRSEEREREEVVLQKESKSNTNPETGEAPI